MAKSVNKDVLHDSAGMTRRSFIGGLTSLFSLCVLGGVRDILDSQPPKNPTTCMENIDKIPRFNIANRRYIGCKQKLIDWIFELVETNAPSAKSFFDVFSGTGVVAEKAIGKYERIIVNDFLYSNEVIYQGFWGIGSVDDEKLLAIASGYNEINPEAIDDNYFSQHFGDKYFEYSLSKIIGEIRNDIDSRANELTPRERYILIASLIYSIDSHANTCGHYEAYIKKPIPRRDFVFGLIDYKRPTNVQIFREDSNSLAPRVHADIAYIDPPYNSRQYSRFYHVYETLVKWNNPELFGEACKPKCENMSDYCRSNASKAFEDLVRKLNCNYLVVSYNNTYSSKSKSSENKITLEELESILRKYGTTKVYSKSFTPFNAGKTDFSDHKEFLFITEKASIGKDNSFVRSPFFYVGDKYKLLPKILPYFPTSINRYVEPFVGGGSVFLNVVAHEYLVNDIDINMIRLHEHLCAQAKRRNEWFGEISELIEYYGLSRSYKEDVVPETLKKENVKTYFARFNKSGYERLRADYNASDRISGYALNRLYLLLIYGFNRMLRYNRNGDFNLPVGNVDFNYNVVNALNNYFDVVSRINLKFRSQDFAKFIESVDLTRLDFVYLDPPYLITSSEYNKLWNKQDDAKLMRMLDDLNAKGVRFALSNVTHYNGKTNDEFIIWASKYNVIPIKSNYINYHNNKDKEIKEVLVINYDK